MATLVLTAVGTAIGGPLGGALGALVGQQVDSAVFGSGNVEGARISDLAITTSTYGQPVPRVFGNMRVPGSIIWATDLQEAGETNSNGKGQPKTTTYSYSMSFAVALSSRPIQGIGRIWADGNLLRGAGGDLKIAGAMRIYDGNGGQEPDPLIVSAIGASSPAFRDFSYVVFEDLQLADFGNRIPALTFEVFADAEDQLTLGQLVPFATETSNFPSQIRGFSDQGGSILGALTTIDRTFPLICQNSANGLRIAEAAQVHSTYQDTPVLTSALRQEAQSGGSVNADHSRLRAASSTPEPRALRYFDIDRDYQTSVQRTIGVASTGREVMLELPAAMEAVGARETCNRQTLNARWQKEQLAWRTAELDPDLLPGSIVQVPDHPGYWSITSWEWMEHGLDLSLERLSPQIVSLSNGEAGIPNLPRDEPPSASDFQVFELPWDGVGSSSDALFFAAASGIGYNWSGAALYMEQQNALIPLSSPIEQRSVLGTLTQDLLTSNTLALEAEASLELSLSDPSAALSSTTISGIAAGANRMLIGNEVIQFLCAAPISNNVWKLSGLLRGRGGTEWAAMTTHIAGTRTVLIDDTILALNASQLPSTGTSALAALALGDTEPVYATLNASGASRFPPAPVHTRVSTASDGGQTFCWTRRSRGQWNWEDGIDTPLIEENESYILGYGPVDQPLMTWQSSESEITLSSETLSTLKSQGPAEKFWVRQLGTFGPSMATLIKTSI